VVHVGAIEDSPGRDGDATLIERESAGLPEPEGEWRPLIKQAKGWPGEIHADPGPAPEPREEEWTASRAEPTAAAVAQLPSASPPGPNRHQRRAKAARARAGA
jgi:hypothetical protein